MTCAKEVIKSNRPFLQRNKDSLPKYQQLVHTLNHPTGIVSSHEQQILFPEQNGLSAF